MGVKGGIRGVTPALRSTLLAVNRPQCTQSSGPSAVRSTASPRGMGVKLPVSVAALADRIPVHPNTSNKTTIERALSIGPTVKPIPDPSLADSPQASSADGKRVAAIPFEPDPAESPAWIRPVRLPGPFGGHVPVKIQLVAHVAVNRLIRQITPPLDSRISNIDLIDVGDGEKRGGGPVFVELGEFQRRDFRFGLPLVVGHLGVAEGLNAIAGIGIDVVIQQVALPPFHGSEARRVPPIPGADEHIGD